MSTDFPTSVDALTNPISTDTLDNPSHSEQHRDINDGMEAVQTFLLNGDGRPLVFVPIAPVVLYNAANTAATITPQDTVAITGVPADAYMVTGYMFAGSNAINNGNFMSMHHFGADRTASVAFANIGGGVYQSAPFTVKPTADSKIRFSVSWAAGTITYNLVVTGYWIKQA